MRRKSLTVTLGGALATALLAVSLGLLATSPVSAQAGLTLTIDPTQGPVGTSISFTVTGCPAVADGPDGRVFLGYGNFSGASSFPGANFEGSPATGSFTVTAPPAGFDNELAVLVNCFASPGQTEEEQAATKMFTLTGATTTTTRPGGTTTTTRPGGTTTTTAPGRTGTPSRPAQPVRSAPSFTG